MAANTGSGYRIGSVRGRTQLEGPAGTYIKRDAATGRFIAHKRDGSPFKGVAKEADGRKTR